MAKGYSSPSEAAKAFAEAQVKARQQDVKYDLRDFTVDYLVRAFGDDLFFIPEYQREFIWPERTKSRFIESVVLGLPIPMLFVADLADGRLEIVDGAQRIQTLEQFVANDLVLTDAPLIPALEGFKFNDLPVPQQRKFLTRALRIVVLEDGTTESIRQELFHRINTQSVRARGSEVRRGSYSGPFIDFVKQKATSPLFLELCPISPIMLKRRENEELVTRFFCYSDQYKSFKHDVERFVGSFVESHRDDFDREKYGLEFDRMLAFVARYFPAGFAKTKTAKSTPRVRFEAISVGVNLALRVNPELAPDSLPFEWVSSDEFAALTTTHASNSGPRLRARIEYVRDKLLAG